MNNNEKKILNFRIAKKKKKNKYGKIKKKKLTTK